MDENGMAMCMSAEAPVPAYTGSTVIPALHCRRIRQRLSKNDEPARSIGKRLDVEYNRYVMPLDLVFVIKEGRDVTLIRWGAIVKETLAAAAANARWDKAPGFYDLLTDQPGPNSWPMTAASFVLLHTTAKDSAKTLAVLMLSVSHSGR
jgi:hypothetical protein